MNSRRWDASALRQSPHGKPWIARNGPGDLLYGGGRGGGRGSLVTFTSHTARLLESTHQLDDGFHGWTLPTIALAHESPASLGGRAALVIELDQAHTIGNRPNHCAKRGSCKNWEKMNETAWLEAGSRRHFPKNFPNPPPLNGNINTTIGQSFTKIFKSNKWS